MMKIALDTAGKPVLSPTGAQVRMEHEGRILLGDVRGWHFDGRVTRLRVAHFNGELWPFHPKASEVEVLERDPGEAVG